MDPLLESLTRLKETWPGSQWDWDGRFSTVCSSFTTDLEPAVRTSARFAFPRDWTASSIETAPEEFRALATETGLRPNQRLLAGADTTTLFGLWWPWGGGAKVTLRIGQLDRANIAAIRELFGVLI